MNAILSDLGHWFWRLLPANPIVVRVVSMGGKRVPHAVARAVYLITLFAVMLIFGGLFSGGVGASGSLAELAKSSTTTFMWVSLVQLFLMSFIAPVFTAGAITQEKDSNTFHILLTTPLSSGQIVLGSLLSRLYFVWALLLSGLPIFGITMIYGGVTMAEVFLSFGLAASTALLTGSLAIAISMMKVGTRRTIFSFFVGIAVYLFGLWFIGTSTFGQLSEAPLGTGLFGSDRQVRMSWLSPVHPFLALAVVTGQTPAPDPAHVQALGWPANWLMAYPQYGYMVLTTLASIVLVILSLAFVRRGAKEGENTFGNRIKAVFARRREGERYRKPRRVWNNPIAWREAATRASAGGRSVLRWVFIVGGLLLGMLLLIAYDYGWWGMTPGNPASVRPWLTAVMWIELAIILLVVTNTAATTLTREKESMTIELLLASPLTSKYIVAGMLRGLVSFALPMMLVPTGTVLLFALVDLFRKTPAVTAAEATALIPVLLVAYASLAAMIGLQLSLTSRKTVRAVMVSTVIVAAVTGLLWVCGGALVSLNPFTAAVAAPFSPFLAMQMAVDPLSAFEPGTPPPGDELAEVRVARTLVSLVAAAAYLGITYSLYGNMVRGFDMTVRKQMV